MKGWLIRAQQPRSKRISWKGQDATPCTVARRYLLYLCVLVPQPHCCCLFRALALTLSLGPLSGVSISRLSRVGALWDCVLRLCGGGGGCAGGGVPLGDVLALSWCGEVSFRGILLIINRRLFSIQITATHVEQSKMKRDYLLCRS